jgi:hypothetical protein
MIAWIGIRRRSGRMATGYAAFFFNLIKKNADVP